MANHRLAPRCARVRGRTKPWRDRSNTVGAYAAAALVLPALLVRATSGVSLDPDWPRPPGWRSPGGDPSTARASL